MYPGLQLYPGHLKPSEHPGHQGCQNSEKPRSNSDHYKSPREVDGDYSYAYSDSVSPAFLIRVGAVEGYNFNYSEEKQDSDSSYSENIYEEINEKGQESESGVESRKSSSTSQEFTEGSSGTSKNRFRKALEAVTRRSSRSLETGGEKGFHLSISKGRQKKLRDRARKSGTDWDCESPSSSRSGRSAAEMFGEVTASHKRVMSQLKLDVEDMLMPPPSPLGDDTQDDSGFHSGGMSSLPSTSPLITKKSSTSVGKKKGGEVKHGRMRKCESMDFIVDPKKPPDFPKHRPKFSCATTTCERPEDSWVELNNTIVANVLRDSKKSDSVNNKYLSKLAPLIGINTRNSYISNNNNILLEKENEKGRTFYL